MNLLQSCKVTYFSIPGRGESIRLALTIGAIPFTDERVTFSQWKDVKPTTPWGSLPYITLADGTRIAQQRAILRLIGKETGLYPTDPIAAAKVDELLDAVEDLQSKTNAAGQGLPHDEKELARAAACKEGGTTYGILSKIDKYIETNGADGHAVGDSISIADLMLYTTCSNLISGLFDGVPSDALKPFDSIEKCRKSVRSHPAVVKYYDGLADDADLPASYGLL